ncbi:hypothetical protein BDM02DRAFT_3109063 [Thelephora ganbajun]|uniref:Uncharacterized protein n=1 Tax=Thelephora ganbajun TaxID=370292 RepID=A0ACB6ZT84_THEGA|nr:hypothetical protein BDM02DRAFT_3109063 [Thelephora ganbajun]
MVVVFMESGTNRGGVDYILLEFPTVCETPFSVTDASLPCRVDRTEGPLSDIDHVHMINHSLNTKLFGDNDVIVSDYPRAETTNSATSILAHLYGRIKLTNGRAPYFVLLGWV